MNIDREFSANASRPSPREVELFFDIEENSLAYIDHNRIKRLVPGEGRDAPSSTILCRLDLVGGELVEGVVPEMLIVENPLPQDFEFKIETTPKIIGAFSITNVLGKIFADPDKARITIDPVTITDPKGNSVTFEPKINLNTPYEGNDTNVLTVTFLAPDGKLVPGENFTSWLQITVFNIQGRRIQKTYKPPVKLKK